jgi:hypothetical protein
MRAFAWVVLGFLVVGMLSRSSLPRGYRNNNPGNIRWDGRTQWMGQTGVDEAGFIVFESPEYGYRAMARVLNTYASRGIDTVAGIIGRWAPASENDTGSYVAHVASVLGVRADAPLVVSDVMLPLVKAITLHENGSLRHTDSVIERGVLQA